MTEPIVSEARLNGECKLKITYASVKPDSLKVEDAKQKFQTGNGELHVYHKERDSQNEDGSLEVELVLAAKPESNIFTFTVEAENLDFYYQDELTEQEKKLGFERPENVVGSYAVYHKSKKNGVYKTGKAFHIYRPQAFDAKGVKVWCNLNVDKGFLTVTVPQDFLEKAAYPVIVDPTFGYTSIGASTATLANATSDYIKGSYCVIQEAATGVDVKVALKRAAAGDNTANVAIYRHSNLIKNSEGAEASTTFTDAFAWYTWTFAPTYVADTIYLLVASANWTASTISIAYDSGATDQGHYTDLGADGFPSPFPSEMTAIHDNNKYSVYADYTATKTINLFSSSEMVSVTRKILMLDDADATTGWYDKTFLSITINMVIITKDAILQALANGIIVRNDAVGLTARPLLEGDRIVTATGKTYEVLGVTEQTSTRAKTSFNVADLAEQKFL